MPVNEEVVKNMDAAAEVAEEKLKEISKDVTIQIADWWKNNYMKAGHKRLAKILLTYATKTESY